jgi:hypothetical protein
MNWKHYLGAVVLLAVGYFIGTKYPNFWSNLPGMGS